MYKLLSHSLSADMPLADPILASPRYEAVQSIARGDLANLFRLTLFSYDSLRYSAVYVRIWN